MKLAEASVFLLLAGAVHVAALTALDLPQGSAQDTDAGSSVTLIATAPDLTDLVQRWENAPDLPAAPPSITTAPVQSSPAALPEPETAPLVPPPVQQLAAAPLIRDSAPADPGLPPPKDVQAPTPQAPKAPGTTASTGQTSTPDAAPRLRAPQAMAAQDSPAPPQIDTRLPALRGIETAAPVALPLPQASAALPSREAATPPARAPAPAAPMPAPSAMTLPQVDIATAQSPQAPVHSLRPALRPEGLAPPPVVRQAQPAKPKPKAKPQTKAKPSGTATRTAKPAATPAAKPKPPAKPKPGVSKQAVAKWQSGIASALSRANRPPRTKATGRVTLSITVAPNGRLSSVRVTRSSGNKTLDTAALANVKRARFPSAPKGFGQTATVRFTYAFTR